MSSILLIGNHDRDPIIRHLAFYGRVDDKNNISHMGPVPALEELCQVRMVHDKEMDLRMAVFVPGQLRVELEPTYNASAEAQEKILLVFVNTVQEALTEVASLMRGYNHGKAGPLAYAPFQTLPDHPYRGLPRDHVGPRK